MVYLFKMDMDPELKIKTIKGMIDTTHGVLLPLVSMFFVSFILPWLEVQYGRFTNQIIRLAEIRDHNHKLQVDINRDLHYVLPSQLINNLWQSIHSFHQNAENVRDKLNRSLVNLHTNQQEYFRGATDAINTHIGSIDTTMNNFDKLKKHISYEPHHTMYLVQQVKYLDGVNNVTRIYNTASVFITELSSSVSFKHCLAFSLIR